MQQEYIVVKKSQPLSGKVSLIGAKNAILPVMASLLLTRGVSTISNVPAITDVRHMITALQSIGAVVVFDESAGLLTVDTSNLHSVSVDKESMKQLRASILLVGPLLARFLQADVSLPGGCTIGARPIDYHLKNFKKMGVQIHESGDTLLLRASALQPQKFVLDYPSVGATENILMSCVLMQGKSSIVNAAIEPEVLDLIDILQKMGAQITVKAPATIEVMGVKELHPVQHTIINDRLEAGALLLAAAVTKGSVEITSPCASMLEVFLMKLEEMGHSVQVTPDDGIRFVATQYPQAVSFKTGPYPSFPTDLQALMMVAQALAAGQSEAVETVFENRFLHVPYLKKMGANMEALGQKATILGVEEFVGGDVVATDIRASCALVLAGLVAQGQTKISGTHHWHRGYESLDQKLRDLGAQLEIITL